MTKDTLIRDIEVATEIARSGQDTPLLGGPIGLMWGLLLTATLLFQYLVLEQVVALPLYVLAVAWITFGVVGGIGSSVLGRRTQILAGANSFGNKVESAVWIIFAAMIATTFTAAMASIAFGLQDNTIWGLVVVIGFMGQGIAYGTTTRIKSSSVATFAALASLLSGAVALILHDTTTVYLVGAIGSFIAIVLPSLLFGRS